MNETRKMKQDTSRQLKQNTSYFASLRCPKSQISTPALFQFPKPCKPESTSQLLRFLQTPRAREDATVTWRQSRDKGRRSLDLGCRAHRGWLCGACARMRDVCGRLKSGPFLEVDRNGCDKRGGREGIYVWKVEVEVARSVEIGLKEIQGL